MFDDGAFAAARVVQHFRCDAHGADDPRGDGEILRDDRSDPSVFGDDHDLGVALGTWAANNNAKHAAFFGRQGDDVADVRAGEDLCGFCLARARRVFGEGALHSGDLLAQLRVGLQLLDRGGLRIALVMRIILGLAGCTAKQTFELRLRARLFRLSLLDSAGLVDHAAVDLVLGEGLLDKPAGMNIPNRVDQVDAHVVAGGERRFQRIGACGC